MKWDKVKLGDVCTLISDGDHKAPPQVKQGIPFVTIANITTLNHFDFSNTMYVTQEYYDTLQDKRKAKKGDILYSVVGSFGIPIYIKEETSFVFQRHIAILRPDKEKIVPHFLYYVMKSRDFYMQADTVAIGAAQRTISLTSLRNMEICIPDLVTQKRISEILSCYDELIEKTQKQIKLLEEAAQRLYKEWFVDLRFPGHEDTKIIDGVPEGWKKEFLSKIALLHAGGDKPKKFSKILDEKHMIPIYSNGTVNDGLYGYTDRATITENSVTISARGSIGYACLHRQPYVPIVRLISVIPYEVDVIYLFLYLKNYRFDSNGAAQQQITIPMMEEKDILIPNNTVMVAFSKLIHPMFDEIDILKTKMIKLQEARDRLLPKLMSGEL